MFKFNVCRHQWDSSTFVIILLISILSSEVFSKASLHENTFPLAVVFRAIHDLIKCDDVFNSFFAAMKSTIIIHDC